MANGKGDLRRPSFIPEHELGKRWLETFGNCNLPANPNVARSQIEAASGSRSEVTGEMEWQDLRSSLPAVEGEEYSFTARGRVYEEAEPYEVEHREIDGQEVTVLTAEDQLPSAIVGFDPANGPDQCVEILRIGDEVKWVIRDGLCSICGENANHSTKCHAGRNTKNPGPRRK